MSYENRTLPSSCESGDEANAERGSSQAHSYTKLFEQTWLVCFLLNVVSFHCGCCSGVLSVLYCKAVSIKLLHFSAENSNFVCSHMQKYGRTSCILYLTVCATIL